MLELDSGRQSDRAYRALKRMLLTLAIPPGGLLNEAELMAQLGVGRTPLREAVQRLTADGLLTVIPRHGTQATPIGGADVRQIMEIRILLEMQTVRLAASRATPADLDVLEGTLSGTSPDAETDDYILFDHQMHALFARAAHNKYLEETLLRLYTLSVRLFESARYQRERVDDMRREHRATLDAIRTRDPRAAGDAMFKHLTIRPVFSQGADDAMAVIRRLDELAATGLETPDP